MNRVNPPMAIPFRIRYLAKGGTASLKLSRLYLLWDIKSDARYFCRVIEDTAEA